MHDPGLLTVAEGADQLRQGRVIAYPTEAVYGLGCDPANETAVREVLDLKERPASAGLILIADRFDYLEPFTSPVEPDLLERAMSRWPGPVTWLFPRAPDIPDWLAGKHPTVALRLTAHPVCRALSAAFGGAIVSTSANPRSEAPARGADEVKAYFGDRLGGIVAGSLGDSRQPSEIRDLGTGRVLREA
ncbi:MAG: Sua5/YciO/YrdC/YwlC family protein [Gammaproteobacteria bacterium]|nr:Sua5/YciO/YrdC/YwlC family protein [Gammaproteobacteria bacterium]